MGRRKPGLWLPRVHVEIETVKNAHRKECCGCGNVPEDRRLKVVNGSGRHAKTDIRCIPCGVEWIEERIQEADRAYDYLTTGEGEIRSG